MRMGHRTTLVGVAAGAVTLLVSVTSVVDLAYRRSSMDVAMETAAALISLLAAQLMYGRFRRSLQRADLILSASLLVFACANLLFAAIPAVVSAEPGPFGTWAPAVSRVVAAALLVAGAFAPSRPVRRPRAAARRMAASCALALAAIGTAVVLARDLLPAALEPGSISGDSMGAGAPALLAVQLVLMALFAAAAIGFHRRSRRTADPLTGWFAIGATLAAFAWLNYSLHPSLHSDHFYTGDMLRLAFFVALLIGGAQEIRVAQRELEHASVLNERRRLAREIHDGIAQDLAFIVQQASAPPSRGGFGEVADEIATAARRALDESRAAIAALVRPTDEPLGLALTRVAQEAAGRWGGTVEARCRDGIELAPPAREALMRIVGEAVTNAARHGGAQRITLELDERPQLCVRISDDGVGFDTASLEQGSGRHGIMGMRDRAAEVDGNLRVQSRPGAGTIVTVMLP